MKIEDTILNNFKMSYSLEDIYPLDKILFLDIETTGFLSGSSSIYMIGVSYYKDGNWCIKQFFANNVDEEQQIVCAFLDFASEYEYIIHYNGNTFDLPFIKAKADKYNLDYTLNAKEGLDIYRRITPYKNLLKLPDCKLKTVEVFLGIEREDEYNGGELIQIYSDYCNSHDFALYKLLLLHNLDDMKGMLNILPILSYFDLFNCPLKATKVTANRYKDINGIMRNELFINISIGFTLPSPISFMGQGCHFKAADGSATLVVPIYEEELKYFYSNYKDYYYLPLEDTALHKSIATFVDKDFRTPAKASNCYTRKSGTFLPQWSVFVEPFFKREYDSTDLFFELTDDVKKNRELFNEYISHVLNKIAFQK